MFSKLNFHVPEETMKRIVLSTAGAIEPVLTALREKIDKKLEHTTENILVCTACLYMYVQVIHTFFLYFCISLPCES